LRTDSQLVEGYVRVVALLAERPRGHEIAPMDVGSALASEREVSRPDALRRHIELMCRLGYLEHVPGSAGETRYRIGRKGRELLRSETVGWSNGALEAGAKT